MVISSKSAHTRSISPLTAWTIKQLWSMESNSLRDIVNEDAEDIDVGNLSQLTHYSRTLM